MSGYYDDEAFEDPPESYPSTVAVTSVAAAESTRIRQTRLPRPAATTTTKHIHKHHHHHKHKQNHAPLSPSSTLRIYGPEGSEDDVAHSGAAARDATRTARKKSIPKEPPGFVPDLPAAKIYSPNKKPTAASLVAPAAAAHRTPGMGGQKTKQKKRSVPPPPPAAPAPPAAPKRALSTVVNPAQLTNANFEEIAKLVAVIDAQKERIRGLTDANKTMKIVKQRQDKALQQMGKQQATFPNLVKQLSDEIRTLKYDRQRTREALTEKFHESLQKHAENVKLRLALVEARKAELELRMSQQRTAEAKGVPAGRGRGRGEQPRGAGHAARGRGREGRGGGGATKVGKSTAPDAKPSVGQRVHASLPAAPVVHGKKETSRITPHASSRRQPSVAASQSSPVPLRESPHRGADSRAKQHNDNHDSSSSDESDHESVPHDRAPAAALVHASSPVSDTDSTASEPAYGSDFESDGDVDDDAKPAPEQSVDDITPTPVVDDTADADYASDFDPAETPTVDVVDSAEEIDSGNDNDELDMAGFVPTAADRAYLSQLGVEVPSPTPPPPVHNDPTPVAFPLMKSAILSASADSAAPSTIHKPNLFARPAPELSVSPPLQRQGPQQEKTEPNFVTSTIVDQTFPRPKQSERQQQLPTQHKLDFLASSTLGHAVGGPGTGSAAAAAAYPSWLRGPAEAASS
ncbi:hypothetical protein HDU87_000451 [Geranomyces variabilis]|uniref:Lebercilin domain-containing protein n=1 Tax=Geranomyces variabilis TaxID=109894 RepID=A0AAD5XUE4_9FUNG|nr:hypothetical protein HDU87_000451 [Geranomyces variabilis]